MSGNSTESSVQAGADGVFISKKRGCRMNTVPLRSHHELHVLVYVSYLREFCQKQLSFNAVSKDCSTCGQAVCKPPIVTP